MFFKKKQNSSTMEDEAAPVTPSQTPNPIVTTTSDEPQAKKVAASSEQLSKSLAEALSSVAATAVPSSTNNDENQDTTNNDDTGEKVDFKVIFNKKKHDVTFNLDGDVGGLKKHLQPIIDIPPAMMKVMIKGLAKDEMTLRQLGVTKGAKVMVVGSTLDQVMTVSKTPSAKELKASTSKGATDDKESTCKQKQHKKILDKGKPEDAMVGIKGSSESLPPAPLSGMLNKHGGKVRLTFKMELDQVWIGTKERTEKVPMSSIKAVLSEPIEGNEEYHIMALQLGPTEASRYWIYWVPAQYVSSIKDAILGKWQYF